MTSSSSHTALLRGNADFRRLWLADLVSLFGDWFNTIALYTAVDALLGTGTAVGWVVICKSLPVFLVSPLAGPLADRFSRRGLMIAACAARAVIGLLLVAAYHLESVVGLYGCTVASMACAGVFLPAKTAAIPMLVRTADVGVANAIFGATWSVTLAFGAAIGGAVTDSLGISASLLFDAATYVLAVLLLVRLPALRPPRHIHAEAGGILAACRYFARTPRLVPMLLLKSGMTCTSGAIPLFALYGNRVLSSTPNPWLVGLLFAGRGAGAAVGSILGRKVFGETRGALLTSSLAGFPVLAVAYGALSMADTSRACILFVFVAGIGNSLIWVGSSILLQREVDPSFHGRAFSLDFGLMAVVQAAVILTVTGLVDAALFDPRQAMVTCALAALPPGILLTLGVLATRDRPTAGPGDGSITSAEGQG